MLNPDLYGWLIMALSLAIGLSGVFMLLLNQKIERFAAAARAERKEAYREVVAAQRAAKPRVPGL